MPLLGDAFLGPAPPLPSLPLWREQVLQLVGMPGLGQAAPRTLQRRVQASDPCRLRSPALLLVWAPKCCLVSPPDVPGCLLGGQMAQLGCFQYLRLVAAPEPASGSLHLPHSVPQPVLPWRVRWFRWALTLAPRQLSLGSAPPLHHSLPCPHRPPPLLQLLASLAPQPRVQETAVDWHSRDPVCSA